MKKVKGLGMKFSEFDELVAKATNNICGVVIADGDWFYVMDSDWDYDEECIVEDIKKYLGIKTMEIIVDICKDELENEVVIVIGE